MKNTTDNTNIKPWKVKEPKQKKPFPKWLKVLLITLLCFLGLTVIIVGAGSAFVISMINKQPEQAELHEEIIQNSDMFEMTGQESEGNDTTTAPVGRKEGFYNILVIGRDKVALNTDVMLIASFDTKNGKAATVQIPRDSYVEDADGNKSKINAVFARGYTNSRNELSRLKRAAANKEKAELEALCEESYLDIDADTLKKFCDGNIKQNELYSKYGIKALQDVISRTFGIYFDYYAIVSTDAFVQIVDAIGGVDVYVQHDMHYDDPYQDLHIHINKGQQHLNGKQAEGFVRYRAGYAQADIARLDAQKIFLTAFFEKLLSFSTVAKVDDIVSAVFDCVSTDMTLENAMGFVKPALSLDLSSITMLNMQGSPYNNGSYYSLNKAENLKIVNEYFNIFTHPLSESAVNVVELVKHQDSGEDPAGMTMEDITTEQPHLGFLS